MKSKPAQVLPSSLQGPPDKRAAAVGRCSSNSSPTTHYAYPS